MVFVASTGSRFLLVVTGWMGGSWGVIEDVSVRVCLFIRVCVPVCVGVCVVLSFVTAPTLFLLLVTLRFLKIHSLGPILRVVLVNTGTAVVVVISEGTVVTDD